ncbi:MAG: TauD/TfdA family dioxygenase [Betaproteobacteria bacterium]|nr:TauD/TfdA family dioxygenase [Betaproteobacteria bacterium]
MIETTLITERTSAQTLSFVPLSPVLGAQVHCGSLARPDEQDFDAIRKGLLDHMVLLFRGQDLTDPELIAFGRQLHALDNAPLGYTNNQKEREHEEMLIVSNVKEDGVPIGVLGDAEVVWHSDNSYRETPLSYSLLYAVELPDSGGETAFANMYMAYDNLSADLKTRLSTLTVKHDTTYNSAGELRRGFQPASDPITAPGPYHPLVRTHPETGRNALYLGRRPNAYVCGLSLDESESLLNMLWAHAAQERFTWQHTWKKGDVLIWDNRCLMHHRKPFDPCARRVLHRLQFRGDRPYHDPRAAARGSHPRAPR